MKTWAFLTYSAILLLAPPVLANNNIELTNRIDSAEKNGLVSREAIVQLRADQSNLDKEEADIRAKNEGLLPAAKAVRLTKERRKLIAKLEKMEVKKPDNTAQNYGDARKESPTPQVQSGKKSDMEKVQSIRKALVNDKGLSNAAKNVKVMVINGTVTLRGVVDNETEKAKVASTAKQFADNSKILDELEVNYK